MKIWLILAFAIFLNGCSNVNNENFSNNNKFCNERFDPDKDDNYKITITLEEYSPYLWFLQSKKNIFKYYFFSKKDTESLFIYENKHKYYVGDKLPNYETPSDSVSLMKYDFSSDDLITSSHSGSLILSYDHLKQLNITFGFSVVSLDAFKEYTDEENNIYLPSTSTFLYESEFVYDANSGNIKVLEFKKKNNTYKLNLNVCQQSEQIIK